jgi:cleavage and polyadenylation specificity factor subunit 3
VGSLANNPPREGQILNGVLVQKDFNMSLVSPEDLREFAGLETNVVMQRQLISFRGGLPLLKWHLEQMFGGVILESGDDEKKPMFKVSLHRTPVMKVMDSVVIVFEFQYQLSINWIGNAMNDTIADSVLAIILAAESSPASLKGFADLRPANPSNGSNFPPHDPPTKRPSRPGPPLPGSAIRRDDHPRCRRG